ncbi:MAG TPA: hypothetical protein VM389_05170 [Phycisphaerae bacterium]|nr:hypothetical protein [Phycisphaerae bacterium]
MATSYGKLSPGRRRVLAVVMLGTLAAMMLAAWSLQWPPARRIDAAVEVLAKARAAPADELWPAEPRIDWYLRYDGPGVTGWTAAVRGRADDGQFLGADLAYADRGADLAYPDRGGVVSIKHWSLNQTLTGGSYMGKELTEKGPAQTTIDLKGGLITTRRIDAFGVTEPKVEAPENYLPKGTLEVIAWRMAGDAGSDAQFRLIFNQKQRHPNLVVFGSLQFRGLGQAQDRDGQPVLRTRITGVRTLSKLDHLLEFDRDGTLARVLLQETGGRLEGVSPQELLRHDPRAAQILWKNLQQHPPDPAWPPFLRRLESILTELAGPTDEVGV